MTSEFAEKFAELEKKKQENESLRVQVSRSYALLLEAFWQKYPPLAQVKRVTFTPEELQAWMEKKAGQRRLG